MQLSRPAFAIHPALFGKGQVRDVSLPRQRSTTLNSDIKLFATTFVAGFLFVSILIG